MPARSTSPFLLVIATLFVVAAAACKSDSTGPSGSQPIANPSGPKNIGDLVSLNVNPTDPCTNAVYHAARVVAIGTKSIVYNDTLNPKNGFTTADFERYAARFDSLVYPIDVANFGEPTDIDQNGRIAIVFTRTINELTAPRSASYTGGLAFSRDLFPNVATQRAEACAGSNQGEYFYALTPDPTGSINTNIRTTGFVDSVTTAVLAHELQHIINSSRRLYVNNTPAFETKWLDEGLAHIAEELLFYRESGLVPRSNLDVNSLRATKAASTAYNLDMSGNAARYRSYLIAPSINSPYSPDDSLPTRGAGWSFLRYAADRFNATDGFGPGTGQTATGSGDLSLSAGAASGDYVATVVNTSLVGGSVTSFILKTATTSATTIGDGDSAGPMADRVAFDDERGVLRQDEVLESRRHTRERQELTPLFASARAWYASRGASVPPSTFSRNVLSSTSFAGTDAELWYKLVNNQSVGIANLQGVFGSDLAGYVRDWSVSHAVDDVAMPGTQYQQRSWNWHSIYPNLGTSISTYPLAITNLSINGVTINSSVIAGGASFYKFSIPANGNATISLSAPAGATNPNLQLVIVRTR